MKNLILIVKEYDLHNQDAEETMALWASLLAKPHKNRVVAFDAYRQYKIAAELLLTQPPPTNLMTLYRRAEKHKVDYFDLKKFKNWIPNLVTHLLNSYQASVSLHDVVIIYGVDKGDLKETEEFVKDAYPDTQIVKCLYRHEGVKRSVSDIPKGYDFLLGLLSPRGMNLVVKDVLEHVS